MTGNRRIERRPGHILHVAVEKARVATKMRRNLGQRPDDARQRLYRPPALPDEIADGRARELDEIGRLDVRWDDHFRQVFMLRAGRKIISDAERRHAGDPVHRAVMNLDVDGEGAALEPLDERVLPQRPTAVERDGVQLRDQRPQLLHATGLRQGGVTDVVVEVDLVFDDPGRMVDAERRGLEAAAIRGEEIESGRHMLAEAGEEIVPRRGGLKDRHAGDMHGRLGRLHVEEERVEQGETFHGEPPAARRTPLRASSSAPRQCPAISSTRSGISASGRKWPIPGTMRKRAPGMLAAVSSPPANGTSGSWEPCKTRVGARTLRSFSTRFGAVWMAIT